MRQCLSGAPRAAPVVWYAASNVDITEQLIKGYDAKYGSRSVESAEQVQFKRPPQHGPKPKTALIATLRCTCIPERGSKG